MTEPRGIYARVSTREQAEAQKVSIPNQTKDCGELCERKGYSIHDNYVDAGYSSKEKDRPAYRRMIEDIKAGRIKGIIAWKWDRLGAGRGIYPLMDAIEEHPITIETVHEGVMSPLMLSMLTSFRAQVLKDQHDRLMSAGATRLEQGKPYGGYDRYGHTYDADLDTWLINEEEAAWVKAIFEWYTKGIKVSEIRQRLITGGARQRKRTKRPWAHRRIRGILRNPAYKGSLIVSWDNQPYELECPPIVTPEMWQAAQNRMDRNNTWRDHNVRLFYLLSGLVQCGGCNHHLHAVGKRYKYKDGERIERKTPVRYYRCKNYSENCCYSGKHISATRLETAVWEAVADYLKEPDRIAARVNELVEKFKERKAKAEGEAGHLESRLEALRKERIWLITQARKGVINEKDFATQIALLDTEQREVEEAYQLATAEIPDPAELVTIEQFAQTAVLHVIDELERLGQTEPPIFASIDGGFRKVLEERKRLLQLLVDKIIVYPDQGILELHGTLERVVSFKGEQAHDMTLDLYRNLFKFVIEAQFAISADL